MREPYVTNIQGSNPSVGSTIYIMEISRHFDECNPLPPAASSWISVVAAPIQSTVRACEVKLAGNDETRAAEAGAGAATHLGQLSFA